MKKLFRAFKEDQKGVTAIEYGLIATLIAVVLVPALTLAGTTLATTFGTITTALN